MYSSATYESDLWQIKYSSATYNSDLGHKHIRMSFDDTRRTFERQLITLFRWHWMICNATQWHWNGIQWRSKNIRRPFDTFDDIECHVMLWWRSNAIRCRSKDIWRHWIAGDAVQWHSKDIRRHSMTFECKLLTFDGHSKDIQWRVMTLNDMRRYSMTF